MQRKVYSVLYWIAAVIIGLGAFGHGLGGAKQLHAALATVALNAGTRDVIWIVWYFVSGCMLFLGGLSIWAWYAMRQGRNVAVVPTSIGVLYFVFGVSALAYGRTPFWILFIVLGVMLLLATRGLRGQTSAT